MLEKNRTESLRDILQNDFFRLAILYFFSDRSRILLRSLIYFLLKTTFYSTQVTYYVGRAHGMTFRSLPLGDKSRFWSTTLPRGWPELLSYVEVVFIEKSDTLRESFQVCKLR